MSESLERELQSLLNRFSMDNISNTPDFVLAQFLLSCLKGFDAAVQQRETYYGRDVRPSVKGVEILYSGQCNHQIPFGQPCQKCGR